MRLLKQAQQDAKVIWQRLHRMLRCDANTAGATELSRVTDRLTDQQTDGQTLRSSVTTVRIS